MEQRKHTKLFTEDVDDEDEDWVDIRDASLGVPQEDRKDVARRLAAEGGCMQQTALKVRERAIEGALTAAGITGLQLVDFMKGVAEDSGWLSNCDTVDQMIKELLKKYPLLRKTNAVLNELKASFRQGREIAESERMRAVTSPAALTAPSASEKVEKWRQMVVVASEIRREDFAGFEEVPLDETDLDWEGEVVEMWR